MDPMDSQSLELVDDALRKTMLSASGAELDAALADLGWLEMLDEMPDAAIPLVFRALGETGAHAPVLNDVVLRAAGSDAGGTVALPFTGGNWVIWERAADGSRSLPRLWTPRFHYAGWPHRASCRWWPAASRWDGGWSAPPAPCWSWRAGNDLHRHVRRAYV